MKILVFSDSHGETALMHEVIQKESCDVIIHLGDCFEDMLELKDCYDIPVYGVIGNVDYAAEGPLHEKIVLGGYRFYLTHGHRYHVKQHLNHIRAVAFQTPTDVVLFGHTHEPILEEHGHVLMNPGSISRPRAFAPSYGVITLENDGIKGKIVYTK